MRAIRAFVAFPLTLTAVVALLLTGIAPADAAVFPAPYTMRATVYQYDVFTGWVPVCASVVSSTGMTMPAVISNQTCYLRTSPEYTQAVTVTVGAQWQLPPTVTTVHTAWCIYPGATGGSCLPLTATDIPLNIYDELRPFGWWPRWCGWTGAHLEFIGSWVVRYSGIANSTVEDYGSCNP